MGITDEERAAICATIRAEVEQEYRERWNELRSSYIARTQDALVEFIERVGTCANATPAEYEALPKVAEVVLNRCGVKTRW